MGLDLSITSCCWLWMGFFHFVSFVFFVEAQDLINSVTGHWQFNCKQVFGWQHRLFPHLSIRSVWYLPKAWMNFSTCFYLPHEYIIIFTFLLGWALRLRSKCCWDIHCCVVAVIISGNSGSSWCSDTAVDNWCICYILLGLSRVNTQSQMVLNSVTHKLFHFLIRCYCSQCVFWCV